MKFKPLPYYEKGLVDHSDRGKGKVGRMLVQPHVRDPDELPVLLDDAVGKGFAVIGINEDPAPHLGPGDRDYIEAIGGSVVQINRSRRGNVGWRADPRTIVLDDLDGYFWDMLLKAPSERFIILRPDRYVFAIGDAPELAESIASLRAQLGAPSRNIQRLAAE